MRQIGFHFFDACEKPFGLILFLDGPAFSGLDIFLSELEASVHELMTLTFRDLFHSGRGHFSLRDCGRHSLFCSVVR